jgi:hypothetical protein
MYYYIVKCHGETEWRSHPYLTQTQILDLPIPDLRRLPTAVRATLHVIGGSVQRFARSNVELPPRVDAKVEALVARLYGLSRRDYERIYETLDSVEALLPVRALKKVGVDDIFGS